MSDISVIKEYKSYMIFWDCIFHCYYFWNNGKKVKSRLMRKIIEKIDKL